MSTPAARSAAARQRRYRRRQHCGEIILEVAVKEDDIVTALSGAGWLSERQALDRREIAHAIEVMLADWAGAWHK